MELKGGIIKMTKTICKHKFHFCEKVAESHIGNKGRYMKEFAEFVCEKCGLLKKIPIKEK